MTDAELYGSRYVAHVLALAEDRSRAHLEFVEFFEDEEGTVPLTEWASSATLRPLPPTAHGWHARLRVGSPCELSHEGGWWEAVVVDRVRLDGGAEGFSVRAALFPAIKYDAAAMAALRPRWAFVDGTDWLALPPLGFKVPLGTAEHTVSGDEASGGAGLRSSEAFAVRAAARAERDADKAAGRARRAAEKAARDAATKHAAAGKARARADGGLPGLIVRAIRAGHAQRDAIVSFAAAHGEACSMKTSRDAVVTRTHIYIYGDARIYIWW